MTHVVISGAAQRGLKCSMNHFSKSSSVVLPVPRLYSGSSAMAIIHTVKMVASSSGSLAWRKEKPGARVVGAMVFLCILLCVGERTVEG